MGQSTSPDRCINARPIHNCSSLPSNLTSIQANPNCIPDVNLMPTQETGSSPHKLFRCQCKPNLMPSQWRANPLSTLSQSWSTSHTSKPHIRGMALDWHYIGNKSPISRLVASLVKKQFTNPLLKHHTACLSGEVDPPLYCKWNSIGLALATGMPILVIPMPIPSHY